LPHDNLADAVNWNQEERRERVEHHHMLPFEPEQGLDLDGESELLAIRPELSGLDLALLRVYR
jgi:hypothetical protein